MTKRIMIITCRLLSLYFEQIYRRQIVILMLVHSFIILLGGAYRVSLLGSLFDFLIKDFLGFFDLLHYN